MEKSINCSVNKNGGRALRKSQGMQFFYCTDINFLHPSIPFKIHSIYIILFQMELFFLLHKVQAALPPVALIHLQKKSTKLYLTDLNSNIIVFGRPREWIDALHSRWHTPCLVRSKLLFMNTATVHTEKTRMSAERKRRLPGKVAYAIFSGVGGTLLLVMFFAAFLDLYQVVKYISWMIAFNTAMTGFSLIEKTRDSIARKHLLAVCAGSANVIITCGILSVFSLYLVGENLISASNFIFWVIIGAVCSELGAWLAVKYFRQGKTTN